MISFESTLNPGHYLTFDPENNWKCIFRLPKTSPNSLDEATFKVVKYGLAFWERQEPRDLTDIYNPTHIISFESCSHPNRYICLNEIDFTIYLSEHEDTPEFK